MPMNDMPPIQTAHSRDRSVAEAVIMPGLAEFERDLIHERVRSGLAHARTRGLKLGRLVGSRPSEKKAGRVLAMHQEGLSYRLIASNVTCRRWPCPSSTTS